MPTTKREGTSPCHISSKLIPKLLSAILNVQISVLEKGYTLSATSNPALCPIITTGLTETLHTSKYISSMFNLHFNP